MIFTDLAAGVAVFVDANLLAYHFQPHPLFGPPCSKLLQRIENQDLLGFTSTHVLGEVAHRLMTMEAHVLFGWPFAGIGNRLRSHPAEVRKLSVFRQAIDKVLQSNLQVLTIVPSMLATASAIGQQIGLLTNDSLIVAVMQANGLTALASTDADFDRVQGLTRYAPV